MQREHMLRLVVWVLLGAVVNVGVVYGPFGGPAVGRLEEAVGGIVGGIIVWAVDVYATWRR